ncbi:MAG: hypothetical protein CL677_01830 [Bdellovibrionaceae bacterium]|nr:hypothetical protein [Pseudobdellovibrionaceae bacterium]|tara:strand:- start:97317 stop:98441 length:1125 start_codon:yes stop_codon:yes gene_type:complete
MNTVFHPYKSFFPEKGGINTVIDWIVTQKNETLAFFILCTHRFGLPLSQPYGSNARIFRSLKLFTLLSMPIMPFYLFQFWWLSLKSNIVHHHHPMPLNDLAIFIFFPKKTKLIVHWHSEVVEQKKTANILSFLFKSTLRRADLILISNPNLLKYSPFLSDFENKVQVIPFGIEIDDLINPTNEVIQLKNQLQREHPPFALTVGRLVKYKGHETLIRSLSKTDAHLKIIGNGPLYDELLDLVSSLGLQDRVEIVAPQSRERLIAYFLACEFFVLPSITINEAFGIVQIEAMASQKAIINTELESGVPWVARHKKEALTVAPKSVDELAAAINLLKSDDQLRDNLAGNALNRAKELFTYDKFVSQINQTYEDLLKK